MTNFTTGRLILLTTADDSGVCMIAVEWCPTCYALVPEDFMGVHVHRGHPEGGADFRDLDR